MPGAGRIIWFPLASFVGYRALFLIKACIMCVCGGGWGTGVVLLNENGVGCCTVKNRTEGQGIHIKNIRGVAN